MEKSQFRMEKNSVYRDFLQKTVQNTSEKNIWMEKSPFRMEMSPFWMEFVFQQKNVSEKNEWRFLHSERRKLSAEFFFFLKFKTRLKNIWMEKSPFRMEISPFWTEKTLCRVFFKIKFKTLLKKNKWINLHSEWRFLHSEWRKLSVEFVFQKKSSKRFWRKWKEKSPF